ncbi:MAG: hypothetical protein WC989_07450 [Micavibrio sp.]
MFFLIESYWRIPKAQIRGGKRELLDLLQISRHENEMRRACRRKIRLYRLKHAKLSGAMSGLGAIPVYWKSQCYRRHACGTVGLYRRVRKERMRAFSSYIGRLPVRHAPEKIL